MRTLPKMLFLTLLAGPLVAAEAPKVVILDMPVIGQQKNTWCWAAVSQMVLRYLKPEDYPKQCELVSEVVSTSGFDADCCEPSSVEEDDRCATRGLPALSGVGQKWYRDGNEDCHYDSGSWRKCRPSHKVALSWTKLKEEIDGDRPVILSWRHDDGSSHIMVATGYVSHPPDGRWVVINDPWPPHLGSRYLVPYDVFVSGPYRHFWDQWRVGWEIGR